MKKMKKIYWGAAVLLLSIAQPILAQISSKTNPMILLSTQQVDVNYRDTTFSVAVKANCEFTTTNTSEWIKVKLSPKGNKATVKVTLNPDIYGRSGTISFTDKTSKITRTLVINQDRERTAELVQGDPKVKVASATATSAQGGAGIEKSYDGDMNTIWHSNWSNSGADYFPITATYNFTNVDRIDYVVYYPRTSGSNGNFKEVEVWYKLSGQADYTKYGDYNFKGTGAPSTVSFKGGLVKPVSVRFVVKSGAGDGQGFATCSEMEFYKKMESSDNPDLAVFGDDVCSVLREGVTQTEIDKMSNLFYKLLAQQLFDGSYQKAYRIGEYECILSPNSLSAEWNTPGKLYDQLQGVTGINIAKGKHIVLVSGVPEDISLSFKVVAWFSQELNDKGIGAGPRETVFALRNGINIINYDNDFDGLAYIAYFADKDPQKYANIKVHIVNGEINGYLSPDKTNEEMEQILANAKNRCIDLVGERVHSIWQAKGMRNYCKASDGVSKGYRQYLNVLDTLVAWEHRLLGFEKYNRIPKNRTMAYVNYTYYMFQGGYGVSFMYDQEPRVLNCKTLMYNDDDAIWGLSHEWGHQHQMQPYFCWTGLSESSNNMNSCYNVLQMGYKGAHGARIQNAWTGAYNHFFNDATGSSKEVYVYCGLNNGNYKKKVVNGEDVYEKVNNGEGDYMLTTKGGTGHGNISSQRALAYANINAFSWCKELQDSITKNRLSIYIPSKAADKERSLSTSEVGVEENTAPFFMLYCYFSANGVPDFQQDLYEALRQNDQAEGSSIEKQGGVDKYELLASAQNNNKNGKYEVFKQQYPQSCWVTHNYVTPNSGWTQNSVPFIFNYIRKASRLSGYNLFPFFDEFGFMKQIILVVDDYGTKYYAMTKEMKEEFKKDMESLNLKELTPELIEKIAHSPIPTFNTPVIPN